MSRREAPRQDALRQALMTARGEDPGLLQLRPTAGGCINSAALVDAFGETIFVKWNDRPLPRQFEAEARGLEHLADADTGLVVPRPIAFSDEPGAALLALEYLPPGRRARDFDHALGRGLAALHATTDERGFGFVLDGYCGATPQPNAWLKDWATFYAERRLGHQLRLARDAGLARADAAVIERAIERARELCHDDEPPALIHGDLWSGNLHTTADGSPSLIDPAAYFGHREAELGMMVLFGGFSTHVFDAYEEVRPLREGWRERLDLYTLYHVLNHFNLFGGGYEGQAVSLARSYA